MRSTFDAIGEGFAIGIASMAMAFSVAAFINVMLEPPHHGLAAKQELAGLMDPQVVSTLRDMVLEAIEK